MVAMAAVCCKKGKERIWDKEEMHRQQKHHRKKRKRKRRFESPPEKNRSVVRLHCYLDPQMKDLA